MAASPGDQSPRRLDRLITGLIGVGLLALYAAGACRTIAVGDSGELVAAVATLGIPHPSGYPLYVLLGKLWTVLLPLGSVAFRMSLFSAVAGAAACALLYRLCRSLDLDRPAAVTAALLLAVSGSFWGEAVVQRVYTLNALFLVVATHLALRWRRERRAAFLVGAFFTCGLGTANHTFMAVLAVALAVWAAATEPGLLRRPKVLLASAGSFAVGLLPYLFLPLRSASDPRLDWGNPESVSALVAVMLRRDYWERAWLAGPGDLLPIAWDWARSLAVELAFVGLALAVVAVVARRHHQMPVSLPLLAMAANLAAMAAHGSYPDLFVWHRYYIPSYVMLALLAAAGAHALLVVLPRRLGWALLLVPLAAAFVGFGRHDLGRYRIADDFSRRLLASLPPGAHLIASDDNVLFPLLYLQLVEGVRPDVDLVPQGVGDADLPPLAFKPEADAVHFTHHPNWQLEGLELVPVGLSFRAWRAGPPPPTPRLDGWWLDGEQDPGVPKDFLTQNLIGHFHLMLAFTFEQRDWPLARRQLELAARSAPANDVLFYNLGLLLRRNGLLEEAVAAFAQADRLNPRELASQGRPRASDRLEETARELDRVEGVRRRLLAADVELGRLPAGSAAYHRRLAALLAELGEALAARGHRLRAEELGAADAARRDGAVPR